VTFLDMMAAPADAGGDDAINAPRHRATSWFSLNMPGYRRTAVFVESEQGQRDLLASWSPPGVMSQPFPNPDRYQVDVGERPADWAFFESRNDGLPEFKRPSRSTATQLYAHWLGTVDATEWGGIIRSDPADPVRVELDEGGREMLLGSIVHDLPGELTNVTIVWVKNQRPRVRSYARTGDSEQAWIAPTQRGQMLNLGWTGRYGAWAAAQLLDLEIETEQQSFLAVDFTDRYVKEYARSGRVGSIADWNPTDTRNYLEMLSFFNQLDPPKYLKEQGTVQEETVAFYRMLGRELDLSVWLTRPCLIVIGQLQGTSSPIPLRVNGEAPEHDDESLTVVRWIVPLEVKEEVAFPEAFGENDEFADT
jgi:hypothetical protein